MPSPEATPDATPATPEERLRVRRWLGVLGLLGAASASGTAFSLYLLNHQPLLLVALSPLGRHITLVTPITDPAALLTVALLRRMIFFLATFQLARAVGPAALDWIEARASWFARFVRWMERLFAFAPRTVVLLMTGPTVSVLAALSGMRLGLFLALATPGLIARLALLITFAGWFREPIEWLLELAEIYWVPGTVVLASAVAFFQWRQRRAARARRAADAMAP